MYKYTYVHTHIHICIFINEKLYMCVWIYYKPTLLGDFFESFYFIAENGLLFQHRQSDYNPIVWQKPGIEACSHLQSLQRSPQHRLQQSLLPQPSTKGVNYYSPSYMCFMNKSAPISANCPVRSPDCWCLAPAKPPAAAPAKPAAPPAKPAPAPAKPATEDPRMSTVDTRREE